MTIGHRKLDTRRNCVAINPYFKKTLEFSMFFENITNDIF